MSNSWRQGDHIFNTSAASGQPSGWVCITSGTFSTYSTTGSITINTTLLTVVSVSGVYVGEYITIAGVSGIKRVQKISGSVITIDSNADATVAGAAVVTPNPTFAAMANLP